MRPGFQKNLALQVRVSMPESVQETMQIRPGRMDPVKVHRYMLRPYKEYLVQPDADPEALLEYAMTDAGNAERLIAEYGDRARYCAAFNA